MAGGATWTSARIFSGCWPPRVRGRWRSSITRRCGWPKWRTARLSPPRPRPPCGVRFRSGKENQRPFVPRHPRPRPDVEHGTAHQVAHRYADGRVGAVEVDVVIGHVAVVDDLVHHALGHAAARRVVREEDRHRLGAHADGAVARADRARALAG